MIIISFVNGKGGVGKTTSSTLAASVLAAQGYDVVIVDFDMQAHATQSLGVGEGPGIYDVMVRDADINGYLVDVDPARYAPPGHPVAGRLRVFIGNDETANIGRLNDDVLFEALNDIDPLPDIVVIDTAPSGSDTAMNNLWYASDYAIIPTQANWLSIDGVLKTVERAFKSDTKILGILPTMFLAQTNVHQKNLENLHKYAEANGLSVFSPIDFRIAWVESSQIEHMITALEGEVGKPRVQALKFVNEMVRRLGLVAQHG